MKLGAFEPHCTWIKIKVRENFIISQLQIRKELSGLLIICSGYLIPFWIITGRVKKGKGKVKSSRNQETECSDSFMRSIHWRKVRGGVLVLLRFYFSLLLSDNKLVDTSSSLSFFHSLLSSLQHCTLSKKCGHLRGMQSFCVVLGNQLPF